MNQAQQAEPNDSAATRVRNLRLALSVTQEQVAAELGWRQSRVSSYERGHFPIGPAIERRITEAIRRVASTKVGA